MSRYNSILACLACFAVCMLGIPTAAKADGGLFDWFSQRTLPPPEPPMPPIKQHSHSEETHHMTSHRVTSHHRGDVPKRAEAPKRMSAAQIKHGGFSNALWRLDARDVERKANLTRYAEKAAPAGDGLVPALPRR